jgi:hypothetical protein
MRERRDSFLGVAEAFVEGRKGVYDSVFCLSGVLMLARTDGGVERKRV